MINSHSMSFILATVAFDAIGPGIIIPVLPDLLKEVMNADVSVAAKWGGLLTAVWFCQ